MNTIAEIEEYSRFALIGYYSLRAENKDLSEVDDFFERMSNIPEISDELERFAYWIEKIGNDIGVKKDYFRSENFAHALPPANYLTHEDIKLRLYCYIVSEAVVILFNGGIKTTDRAQDCPNVQNHFSNAQSWSRKLCDAQVETDGTTILDISDIIINY